MEDYTGGRFPPFNFKLARLRRFPNHKSLFLDPDPKEVILDLTRIIAEAFPDYLPYEGTIPLDELHPLV